MLIVQPRYKEGKNMEMVRELLIREIRRLMETAPVKALEFVYAFLRRGEEDGDPFGDDF